MIRTLYRHRSGTIVVDLPEAQWAAAVKDPQAGLWIDMTAPTESESNHIFRDLFHFHPLAIEDAVQDAHVPKLDDYGAYLYLVFHKVGMGERPLDIHTYEMDAFLGANFFITMHDHPDEGLDKMWNADCHRQNGLARGPAYLLYEVLDRQVDAYIPILDQFERQLEELGNSIFRHPRHAENAVLSDILTAKSSALRLHRILAPQRELLHKLSRNDYAAIPAEARIYFHDVYDHLVRLNDLAESMRDLAGSTIETHLASVNNRTNEVMKLLAVIATIFLPLSFVAGIYGMNFEYMPELRWRYGYPLVLLVFCIIAGGMLYYFRRRGRF
jgi:magnesium transporter